MRGEGMLGPIFRRELVTTARRPGTYRTRAGITALVLALAAANFPIWYLREAGRLTVLGMAAFAHRTFTGLVIILIMLIVNLVPGFIGRGLAEEVERKTLGYIL